MRSSKDDQESIGPVVAVLDSVRHPSVAHLRAWVRAAGLMNEAGRITAAQQKRPVFRRLFRRDCLVDTGMGDGAVAPLVNG